MAQHALTIPDSDGASFLAALNAALAALKTTQSGTGRPPSPSASQFWVDTNTPSATVWTLSMFDGADDIEVGTFDTVANRFTFAGSTIGRQLQWAGSQAAALAAVGARAAPEVIGESVASNHAVLDVTGLDDTYDRYELEILSLVPQINDVSLALRLGTGGGPAWQAGTSAYETNGQLIAGNVGFLGGVASGIFLTASGGGTFGVGNQAGNSISGVVEFCNPEASAFPTFRFRTSYLRPTGNGGAATSGAGYYGTTGAITGLRVLFSSGNIASGRIRLIGYRKA